VGAGESTVLVKATDQAGNAATCAVLLRVKDLTAPVIQSLTADHDVLRPPNHQMVPVALSVVAADNCDSSPSSHIVSVSSSEGGDNNPPDWNITGPLTVQLRAEVFSKEIPRSYSITVVCTDAAGNATQGTVVVQVTKSKN